MIVGGVDLGGRKAAVSIFDGGELTYVDHFTVPKTTRGRELHAMAEWTWRVLKVCDFVVVEEPQIGRGVRSSLQVAQTCGAVMSTLHGIKAMWVPVSTWKKEVVGRGNADKTAVREWLESSHPGYAERCGANQDRIDATCIGLYGVGLLDRSGRLEDL